MAVHQVPWAASARVQDGPGLPGSAWHVGDSTVRTIAIINQKGGCGKTTSAINLAGLLARAGRRILLVDMDPQSHCAAGLGIPEHRLDMDIGDAMLAIGTRPIDSSRLLWKAGRNLDLAPSRMRLAGLEAARGGLSNLEDKERRLAAVLDQFKREYDLAIIDCSPAIGLLTFNALVAADIVVIPVETSFFSLQGATKQVNTVKTLTRRLGKPVGVWLLPTIHDESNSVAADLLLELKRRFKERLIPVVIRRDVRLKEAASFGQSIIDYDPRSQGAEDYTSLATWTLDTLSTMPAVPFEAIPAEAEEVEAGARPDPALIEVLPRETSDLIPHRPSEPAIAEVAVGALTPPAIAVGASSPIWSAPAPQSTVPEIKPVSRAEDVARRAQQFLRRMALSGGATTPAGANSGAAFAAAVTQRPPTPSPSAQAFAPPAPHIDLPHPTLRMIENAKLPPGDTGTATQSLLGVRATRQGVLFVQPLTAGRKICIAGDFNGWSATAHPMKKNEALGVFELCLRLEPGRYRYRLVVDGAWTADQYNEIAEMNPFGELNSIVSVSQNT